MDNSQDQNRWVNLGNLARFSRVSKGLCFIGVGPFVNVMWIPGQVSHHSVYVWQKIRENLNHLNSHSDA
jgi:hypothetical protein